MRWCAVTRVSVATDAEKIFLSGAAIGKHFARPGRPVDGRPLSLRDGRTAGKGPADTRRHWGGTPPGISEDGI